MLGKVVHGGIDPRCMDVAVQAVREELLPRFEEHPGAQQGYWMAHRGSGRILIVTMWSDMASLESARGADGAERSTIADRIGLQIHAIHTMEVVAHHNDDHAYRPVFRSVRATWASSLPSGSDERIPALYEQILPDQSRSTGFRGSYWLADGATGTGLALSFWDGVDELETGGGASRRRRQQLQRQLGFAVQSVHTYEGLGVRLGHPDGSTVPAGGKGAPIWAATPPALTSRPSVGSG